MRIGLIGVGRIGAFHAETLRGLPSVETVVLADVDRARAEQVADALRAADPGTGTGPGTNSHTATDTGAPRPPHPAGSARVEVAGDVSQLLAAGIDGLVIATATGTHAELLLRGVDAGLPVFCEKPAAPDASTTRKIVGQVGDAPVQIGFQRRFDAGFVHARAQARDGKLGWLHTIRSTTFDAEPPPPAYIPGSGGIFRDCAVHDFDAIRWVSGRDVTHVSAAGANRGADFFRAAGDVDTASALLTLADDTLAVVSCGRYNGAGYDVRLELLGSAGGICAGLDQTMPLSSAERGAAFPRGPAHRGFMDRFRDAYVAELAAFTELVAGRAPSRCTPRDALAASQIAEACELSRAQRRQVAVAEVS